MTGRPWRALALAALLPFVPPTTPPASPPSRPVPTPPPPTLPSVAARTEFCSLLKRCGLSRPAACTDELTRGAPGVDYDAERCGPARELGERGVDPTDPAAFRLFRFLGERYQAVYKLEGQVAISQARLEFLLQDLPLAAALLTHFQKTRYEAEYLDPPPHRRFRGRRGDNLDGDATVIAGSPAERDLVYFGRGTSQIGPWKLRGLGLVRVRYAAAPRGKGVRYRVQVVAAPVNAVVNLVMKTGIFRRIVEGHIRDILEDVAEASAKLDQQGLGQGGSWSAEQKERIADLLKLP